MRGPDAHRMLGTKGHRGMDGADAADGASGPQGAPGLKGIACVRRACQYNVRECDTIILSSFHAVSFSTPTHCAFLFGR